MRSAILIIFLLVMTMIAGKLFIDWAFFGDDARCYSKECADDY